MRARVAGWRMSWHGCGSDDVAAGARLQIRSSYNPPEAGKHKHIQRPYAK